MGKRTVLAQVDWLVKSFGLLEAVHSWCLTNTSVCFGMLSHMTLNIVTCFYLSVCGR